MDNCNNCEHIASLLAIQVRLEGILRNLKAMEGNSLDFVQADNVKEVPNIDCIAFMPADGTTGTYIRMSEYPKITQLLLQVAVQAISELDAAITGELQLLERVLIAHTQADEGPRTSKL